MLFLTFVKAVFNTVNLLARPGACSPVRIWMDSSTVRGC